MNNIPYITELSVSILRRAQTSVITMIQYTHTSHVPNTYNVCVQEKQRLWQIYMYYGSPTKHLSLLSHSGAALTPLATRAKKAFFTWQKKVFQ